MPGATRLNAYLFLKLPAAWWCGVRVYRISPNGAEVRVRHRWINQNPFRSMFWAVQGMAAELSTGSLLMQAIKQSGKDVSMLVLNNRAQFFKKATGLITFRCTQGDLVHAVLERTLAGGEGQTVWLTATGTNEEGVTVSTFEFEWTLRLRS